MGVLLHVAVTAVVRIDVIVYYLMGRLQKGLYLVFHFEGYLFHIEEGLFHNAE